MRSAINLGRLPARRLLYLHLPAFLLIVFLAPNVLGQPFGNNRFALLRMNEVNVHAARHVLSHFSPSSLVKWFQNEQYLIANFKEGDSTDKVYYKANGNFDFCIKYYRAEALDPNLKSVVLKKFPGCEILMITELTNLEKKELSIKIKDGNFIKTISSSDEGMEITENIKDSNS
jgi:hypothetical protein